MVAAPILFPGSYVVVASATGGGLKQGVIVTVAQVMSDAT
jgi:hypothetical protein